MITHHRRPALPQAGSALLQLNSAGPQHGMADCTCCRGCVMQSPCRTRHERSQELVLALCPSSSWGGVQGRTHTPPPPKR